MNVPLPAADGAPATRPAAPAYPAFVTNWLRIDLALCVVTGLLALAATATSIVDGDFGGYDAATAIGETLIQYGIATCGIVANLLLLRRQRAGFGFAAAALAFVCAGIALSFHTLQWRIADPETTCPTETLVGGFVLGLFFRSLLNLIYVDALRRAHRFLQRLPSTSG
ncbi:hypothetical protein [Dokdonella sp.]|uniref:hypothetical protein n=1 Tax=Dokdonella sp. TaxID=2291710 RepID=UPI002639F642|nr:hypothetical protein [Dokdonella sp.]